MRKHTIQLYIDLEKNLLVRASLVCDTKIVGFIINTIEIESCEMNTVKLTRKDGKVLGYYNIVGSWNGLWQIERIGEEDAK